MVYLSKQNIIMKCTQEIAELCLAIHAFETSIACLKESLFDIKTVTDDLIWNHVVGQNSHYCTPEILTNYLTKHGLPIDYNHVRILVRNYSSLKNSCLIKSDLWQILKPLTIAFADQMMRNRSKNMIVAKNHQAHYKISDLINQIVKRTLEFILIGQKMKQNIVQAQTSSLNIQPLDAQHLQSFLNPYCPSLLIDDVRLIFGHIIRGRRVSFRVFYEYFIPVDHKSSKINPNHIKCWQVVEENKQISLLKTHIQNSDFGSKKKNKKPLYLIQHTK